MCTLSFDYIYRLQNMQMRLETKKAAKFSQDKKKGCTSKRDFKLRAQRVKQCSWYRLKNWVKN